jgi:dipeptidyl aminopeptidase/acylaminoacyl peptidase
VRGGEVSVKSTTARADVRQWALSWLGRLCALSALACLVCACARPGPMQPSETVAARSTASIAPSRTPPQTDTPGPTATTMLAFTSTPAPSDTPSSTTTPTSTATVTLTPTPTTAVYRGGAYCLDTENKIERIDARTGEVSLVARTQGFVDTELALSPDRSWLSFATSISKSPGDVYRTLWIVATPGGEPVQVSHSDMPGLGWSWLMDNRLLYIEFPNFQMDRLGDYRYLGRQDSYLFDPTTGGRTPASPAPIYRDDCGSTLNPARYGEVLEFCFHPRASSILRFAHWDDTVPVTIAVSHEPGPFAWSTDGKKVFWSGDQQSHIWERDSGLSRTLEGVDSRGMSGAIWSPDDRWIAYNLREMLCALRLEDQEAFCYNRVVSNFGTPVSWSADSNAIVVSTSNTEMSEQGNLWIIGIPDGNKIKLTQKLKCYGNVVWGR